MSAYMQVVETSPNQVLGYGNGCIVSEQDVDDCIGPWVVFHHTERASNIFPHATICSHHLHEAYGLSIGEVVAGGEDGDDDVVTVPPEDVTELGDDDLI